MVDKSVHRRTGRRSWLLIAIPLVMGSISGCVQLGDYAVASPETCDSKADLFKTYFAGELDLAPADVTVTPSLRTNEGDCAISVLIEAPSSLTPEDLVTLAVAAYDAVDFSAYIPRETKLDILIGGELVSVLPPSRP
jgi:hypothetical protein